MGTCGIDSSLQTTCQQPLGQPLELAVAQEAVTLDESEGRDVHVIYIPHLLLDRL